MKKMKTCLYLVLLLFCLLSLAACGGDKEAGEDVSSMTEEEKKLDKMAKSLGYDKIEEDETAGRMFRYGIKAVDDKDMQKEVQSVFSDCTLEISDELDDAYEVKKHGLTVRANAEDAKSFVSDCEVLFAAFFQKDMFKDFDTFYVEHKNAASVSGIHANQDSSGKFSTLCTDTATDKALEKAYTSSRFFSSKDMTKAVSNDIDARTSGSLGMKYALFTERFNIGTKAMNLASLKTVQASDQSGKNRYTSDESKSVVLDILVDPSTSDISALRIIVNKTSDIEADSYILASYLYCLFVIFYDNIGDDPNNAQAALDKIAQASENHEVVVGPVKFMLINYNDKYECLLNPNKT